MSDSTPPASRSATDGQSPSTLKRLEWGVEALRRLGCVLQPHSRVQRALELARTVDHNTELLQQPRIRLRLAAAHRLGWELMVISAAATRNQSPTTVFTVDKLQQILGGDELGSGQNQLSRNTQFELYVPALFAETRFEIRRGRTDASWHYLGEEICIEAKRLTALSRSALDARLEKAASQIIGADKHPFLSLAKNRGLIAVNVDAYFGDLSALEPSAVTDQMLFDKMKVVREACAPLASHHAILGVMVFGYSAHWALEGPLGVPAIEQSYPTMWVHLQGSDPGEKLFRTRLEGVLRQIEKHISYLQTRVPVWN